MPGHRQRHNLDDTKFWTMTCGCPKPVLHWSSDFNARVCQNCGVILTAENGGEVSNTEINCGVTQAAANGGDVVTHNRTNQTFVHLRVHTHLSLLKATCQTKDLIKFAKEYGMPALAKTEFGNMCGSPTFVKDCNDAGIKPILGTEFEVRFDNVPYNVLFIALNRNGYKQLVKLNTLAWCERKQKKIDVHITQDDVPITKDLVALVDVGPNPDMAKHAVGVLRSRLTTYIEVNTEDDRHFNVARHIKSATGCDIVVTGNVLYTREEDREAYGVGLKIGKHAQDFHVPTTLDNWFKPADRYGSFYSYPLECWRGLYEKKKAGDPKYQERLQFELNVMKEKKFSSYFLLIGEIVSFMKKQGIMVPFGRGSSVGSLVCYALDIITMDPIQWDVPFDRFINSGRVDLPDIDTDISQERRGEVLRHIADVHGGDRVAHIATFQTLKLRAAIDNTGRALQVPLVTNRDLKREIPEDVAEWGDLHSDNQSKIKELMAFRPNWLEIAFSLTGAAKNLGYHAAGVVISNESLNELVPLLPPESEGGLVGIQYDMHDCEVLGLLKLDMLGLRNIDIIQHTVDRIQQRHGHKVDVYNLPFDDQPTYDKVSKADYVSVFQLDSSGYRRLCRQLRPANFHHIMALNALFRPGPLEGGMTDEYVERRHGRRELVGWHPWLDEVLSTSYQVPVFQEQVMAISKIIAGFNDVEADSYRKAIGKKDAEKFAAAQKKFKEGALKRDNLNPPVGFQGTTEQWIDELLHKLAGYARYGWNIGHSCGYGWITYVTAYLETHYSQEYYASLLDAFADSTKKLPVLLRAILSTKTRIVPPHINESRINYEVGSDNSIYMGLGAVRNVGKAAFEIVEERDRNGPYKSFIEFCQRMPTVNKTAKINLVKSGAFLWDKMLCDRDKVDNIDVIQKWVKKKNKKFDGAKAPAFEIAMKLEMLQGKEYSELERSNVEREALNTFITGHPADIYQNLSSFLERGNVRVVTPSQINPEEVNLGETVLLVGMVDYIRRKQTQANDRYPSKPYLNLSISDTETFQIANIWYPLCEDLEKIIIAGEVAMFECVIKEDKFNSERYMLKVDTAINLAHGLPIQGVFRVNGYDPGAVVKRIGGMVNQVTNMGNRTYASVRGRISVKPHILDETIMEFGDDIKYLISMDTLEQR